MEDKWGVPDLQRLTPELLFINCPPTFDLKRIDPHYQNTIKRVIQDRSKNYSEREIWRRSRGGGDLIEYVDANMSKKLISTFAPFELLSRIHSRCTVEHGDWTGYQEVSTEIHYKENGVLRFFYVETPLYLENELSRMQEHYRKAVELALEKYRYELMFQFATHNDMLLINRRLIPGNYRAIKSRKGLIKTFRFDWLKRELI